MGLRGNITAGVIVLACLVITGSAATSVNARAAGLLGVPVTGGGWGESGLTGGGFENQIVVSPTDPAHLLLASDIGGIQYSDDGGATWLPRNAYAYGNLVTRVASIEWDPNWPGVAYALVGDGHTGELLRSGDYGFTWAPVTTSLVGAGDGVDPAIHASTGLPMGHPRPIGTLISFDSGYVYVGTFSGGLMRAADVNGQPGAWSSIGLAPGYLGVPNYFIRSVAADPSDNGTIYVATHTATKAGAGKVWRVSGADTASPTATELTGSPTDVQSLLVLDGNLYGAANGGASSFGLYRLGDASQTAAATPWRSISGPGYGDPATYWYSVTGYDVGGVTTLLLSAGNPPMDGALATPVFEGTSADGFATDGEWNGLPAATGDVHSSLIAGGGSWWPFDDPGPSRWGILGAPFTTVSSVAVAPDHQTMWFSAESGVWESTDAGLDWFPVVSGLGATVNPAVAIDGRRAGVVYIANRDYQFFESTDSGATVTRDRPTQTAADNMGHAVFVDSQPTRSTVYLSVGSPDCHSAGSIWTRTVIGNGAGGWTQLATPSTLGSGRCATALAVLHPSTGGTFLLAAVNGSGVWRRRLAPSLGPWQRSGTTTPGNGVSQFAVSPTGQQVLLFDEATGLWASTDGGQHWALRIPYRARADGDGYLAADKTLSEVFLSLRTGVSEVSGMFSGTPALHSVLSAQGLAYGPIAVGDGRLVIALQPNGVSQRGAAILAAPVTNPSLRYDLTDAFYTNAATKVLGVAVSSDGTTLVSTAGDGLLVRYVPALN